MTRRSILHRTPYRAAGAGPRRVAPRRAALRPGDYSRTHPLYIYNTTDPALRRYLQFNNKQPKTYKALSMYKHEFSHAHGCYFIDDCDIHNGYKVLVNTS